MIYEFVLFSVWLVLSVLVTVAAFHVGRLVARKIERFFDKCRK